MAAEKNFENRVKAFLKEHGCWLLKYWGGAAYTKSGVPDLLVCCSGWFLGVELKGPRGRPTDLQIYHLREIDRAGGYGVLLYPDDFSVFQNLIECLSGADYVNAYLYYSMLREKWKHFENKLNGGK